MSAAIDNEGSGRVQIYRQTVITGDCLVELRKLAAGSIDVVATSPPYNIGVAYGQHDDRKPRAVYLDWLAACITALHRVLKPAGSFFFNFGTGTRDDLTLPYAVMDVLLRAGFVPQNRIVWIKSIAVDNVIRGHNKPVNSPLYLTRMFEDVVHCTKQGDVRLDKLAIGVEFADKSNIKRRGHTQDLRDRGNTWYIDYDTVQAKAQKFDHPAGFPVELPEWCIKLHGLRPDLMVLDPFLGAGTTLVAAQRLGCVGVGIEIDPIYVATACRRLAAEPETAPAPIPAQKVAEPVGPLIEQRLEPASSYAAIDIAEWRALAGLLSEATALGTEFRISGDRVAVAGLDRLPLPLQTGLRRLSGLAWHFLGAGRVDAAALTFFEQLGVRLALVQDPASVPGALAELEHDLAIHGGAVGIDVETTPLPEFRVPTPPIRINRDGALSGVQPTNPDRAALDPARSRIAVLQLYAGGEAVHVFHGEATIAAVLDSAWLRSHDLVAHHAGFELGFLQHWSKQHPSTFVNQASRGQVHCTAQAFGLLHGVGFGGSGRSLEDGAKTVLGLTMLKDLQVSDWGAPSLSRGQLAYAASDGVIAYRLGQQLRPELQRVSRNVAYELQRRVIPIVSAMSARGLLLDQEEHARQVSTWTEELGQARERYTEEINNPPPVTPAQIRDWLRSILPPDWLAAWPLTARDKQLSTEGAHLKRVIHLPGTQPVLDLLGRTKLISTFGPKLLDHINPATGRIHPNFSVAGAKTGRFTCSRPNLQQLPATRAPEFRRCIRAAPGNLLIGGDWNQIELRAAAWKSGEVALTALYAEGRDLHREVAAMVARISLDDVTKVQRQGAKAISFGAIYGMGAASLVEYAFDTYGVIMSLDEATEALRQFFLRFPQLHRWRDTNYRTCTAAGRIFIDSGRVIEKAWEPGNQLKFTLCCNAPIQGVCSDAMLRAITLVHLALQRHDIQGGLVATVHDELILEVAEAAAEQARMLLHDAMVLAFEQTFPGAPITNLVAVNVGVTWADLK